MTDERLTYDWRAAAHLLKKKRFLSCWTLVVYKICVIHFSITSSSPLASSGPSLPTQIPAAARDLTGSMSRSTPINVLKVVLRMGEVWRGHGGTTVQLFGRFATGGSPEIFIGCSYPTVRKFSGATLPLATWWALRRNIVVARKIESVVRDETSFSSVNVLCLGAK